MKYRGEPFRLSTKLKLHNDKKKWKGRYFTWIINPFLQVHSEVWQVQTQQPLCKNSCLKEYKALLCPKFFLFFQNLQQVSPCSVRADQPLIFSSKESDHFSSLNMSHSTFYATVSNGQDVRSQCNFMAGVGNLSAPKGKFSPITDGWCKNQIPFNVNWCLYPIWIPTSEKFCSKHELFFIMLLTKISHHEGFTVVNHTCLYCPGRDLHTRYKFPLLPLLTRNLKNSFKTQ